MSGPMKDLPLAPNQIKAVAFVVAPAAVIATLLVGFTSQSEWLYWAGVGLIVGNTGLIGVYAFAQATRRPLGSLLRFGFWVLWVAFGVSLIARSQAWALTFLFSVPLFRIASWLI